MQLKLSLKLSSSSVIYLPDPVISPSPNQYFKKPYEKCLSKHVLATTRASSGSVTTVKYMNWLSKHVHILSSNERRLRKGRCERFNLEQARHTFQTTSTPESKNQLL